MAQGDINITVVGNIVADPELRFTASGTAVASFRVATTPRRFDSATNQWTNGDSMFLNCTAWRQLGENVAQSLSKGMRVIVSGILRDNSYEDNTGNRRTSFEILVDEVGPSLRYATAEVTRAQGGGYGAPQSAPRQPQQSAPQNFQQQAPVQDPWNSAPTAGGMPSADDEPPF